MARQTFAGKSVLITGASSGIGAELARQLGQAGAQLTLTARRTDLLDVLAQRIAGAEWSFKKMASNKFMVKIYSLS